MDIDFLEKSNPLAFNVSGREKFQFALDEAWELAELQHDIGNLCFESRQISERQIIPENILLPGCLLEGQHGPAFVEILPIDICNHACDWCFTAASRSVRFIQPNQLRARLEHFISVGGKSVLFSGGGEPLLYKPLIRSNSEFDGKTVIEWLSDRNIIIGLITNGVYLDRFIEAHSGYLSKTMAFIRISLDACTAADYSLCHQANQNDFGLAIDSIKAAVSCRDKLNNTPAIGVSFVVDGNSGLNAQPEAIDAIQKLATDLEVDYVQLKHAHTNNEHAADALMLKISKWIATVFPQRPEFWIHRYQSSRASQKCYLPLTSQVLRADGARSPCCHLQGISVPEQESAYGFSPFMVHNCTSNACRFVSMNRLLDKMFKYPTDYINALYRLKHSLMQDGFHPYRLFPSAPDLVAAPHNI